MSVTESNQPPLLACRNVCKFFGALAAVNNLSFEVKPGEVLGISGPNGAGKTTLFDVVSGLSPADSGDIVFDGVEISHLRADRICQMGIARTFQLNAAFDSLTARENVLIAAYYGRGGRLIPGLRFDGETEHLADEAIRRVGISDQAGSVVKDLPVFHRKLLMLAGALASSPKLLLMDEPVGGLNLHEIDQVMSVVDRVRDSGVTTILIEHVMRFLVQVVDRALVMHHGESIYEGPAEGLTRDKTVIEVYLGKGASHRLQHLLEETPAHG